MLCTEAVVASEGIFKGNGETMADVEIAVGVGGWHDKRITVIGIGDLTFTLDENVISRVYKTFEKMWNDGMIYRGEKLVNFCPHHQTAFADIEVEHQDESGHLWVTKPPMRS